jgi:hypothetical protein
MIIKKTETIIYLDNALPEELLLSFFSKKVMVKAVKKSAEKKSSARKAAGKKRSCG